MKTFEAEEKISRGGVTARPTSHNWWDWKLWLQWTFANVAGEVLGLGLAAAVATAMVLTIGEPETAHVALTMAGVMITAGALEGVIVGFAQWLVLRRRLCRMGRRQDGARREGQNSGFCAQTIASVSGRDRGARPLAQAMPTPGAPLPRLAGLTAGCACGRLSGDRRYGAAGSRHAR